MTNPLDIALTKIHNSIPVEILEFAFQKRKSYELVTSIDNLIIEKVIRARVAKDMNVYGGKVKDILLRNEYVEPMARNIDDAHLHTGKFSLYRIPPEARDSLPIVEVSNVKFWGMYVGNCDPMYANVFGANFNTLAHSVLDAHTFSSSPRKPDVTLLSGDLVKVLPSQHAQIRWVLSCRLAFDDCFTNLNTTAIEPFADLCLYATQAYIFMQTTIAVDKAYIQAGYAVGQFKSILDSYADANQKYDETLNLVAGAMQLSPDRLYEILPYLL